MNSFLGMILIFVVIVISSGAVPFILGFLFQSFFINRKLPKSISWVIAAIITIPAFSFPNEKLKSMEGSILVKVVVCWVSIIVIAGFMDSGIRTREKLRDWKAKKALRNRA